MNTILKQYLASIGLALLLIPITEVTQFFGVGEGWQSMVVLCLAIIACQVWMYNKFFQYTTGMAILSFIVNIVVWIIELVLLERAFPYSFIYEWTIGGYALPVFIIGAALWTSNKLLLDKAILYISPDEEKRVYKEYTTEDEE